MMCFRLCFSHVNAIFESFFTSFLIGLLTIGSLLIGIDCVTDTLKAKFLSMKNTLFRPQI